ncbi:MAG: helix-turn-helix domain-containing protein, partial [Nocardioidaceae bacterium]
MSQRDLAVALKRSDSWVSQVERDVLPVERVSILQRLADTLGVSVHDLRPETTPTAEPAEREVSDLESLRLAMTGHPAPRLLVSEGSGEPADNTELRRRVDNVWDLTHASR